MALYTRIVVMLFSGRCRFLSGCLNEVRSKILPLLYLSYSSFPPISSLIPFFFVFFFFHFFFRFFPSSLKFISYSFLKQDSFIAGDLKDRVLKERYIMLQKKNV